MSETAGKRASLTTLVARRVLAFAFLAMLMQLGIVFAEYWSDETELGRIMIEKETARIAAAVRIEDGKPVVDADAAVLRRYAGAEVSSPGDVPGQASAARQTPATFVRVRTDDGRILFTNCSDECREHFLPMELDPPDFWQSSIAPGKPLSVRGGRLFVVGSAKVLIEIAIVRDPDHFLSGILLHEILDHMLVPMSLMLIVVIGATIVSIRKALRPVAAAAALADRLEPGTAGGIAGSPQMPLEIGRFVEAINRLLGRTHELFVAQKVFAAAVAHEIRTPVAIVKLELGRIDDARARRAEADLDRLMHVLEQLTALARLDAVEPSSFVSTDLTELAAATVADVAPLVLDRGKRIVFDGNEPVRVMLVPALIENVIRNLIENAVKHTGDGTEITVSVTADGVLTVADDGQGLSGWDGLEIGVGRVKRSGSLGMGLRIVERIAELHGLKPEIKSEPGRGTVIRLAFARIEGH